MGASQWVTFIDHDADPKVAFKKAKEAVFAAGDYYRADPAGPAPANIREALLQADEEGTHSILDLSRLDTDPPRSAAWGNIGVARVLTSAELRDLFGTDRPTRARVDAQRHELSCERGTGRYFVVYEDDKPHAYCFFGVTGD